MMVDRSVKCTGVNCPLRLQCIRYMSERTKGQAYGPFDLFLIKGKCIHQIKFGKGDNNEQAS